MQVFLANYRRKLLTLISRPYWPEIVSKFASGSGIFWRLPRFRRIFNCSVSAVAEPTALHPRYLRDRITLCAPAGRDTNSLDVNPAWRNIATYSENEYRSPPAVVPSRKLSSQWNYYFKI
jgi:hypothetical protein